jgi:hypothetical protein
MTGSSTEERTFMRDIKRTHKRLEIKSTWYWVEYDVKKGINIFSENHKIESPLIEQASQGNASQIPYKSTGLNIITSKPKTDKDKPVGYYKTEPIYAPFIICALPPNSDYSKADSIPFNSVFSVLEDIYFSEQSSCQITINQ